MIALCIALASWRLWRLFALDTITEFIRARMTEGSWPWTFLTCPWCSGTWITAGLWGLAWWQLHFAAPGLVLGAACALTGVFGTLDKWWHERG